MFEIVARYLEIPAELLVAYSVESAALPPLCISLFMEILEIFKSRTETSGLRRELRVEVGWGALGPGADLLTYVAAGDHRPDARPKFGRNRGPVLDCEIADTATGIEHLWFGEGCGGAGIKTGGAGAAVFGSRPVR